MATPRKKRNSTQRKKIREIIMGCYGRVIPIPNSLEIPTLYAIDCFYCNKTLYDSTMTIDHVVPLARDGKDILENMVPSCEECNGKKEDTYPEQYIINRLKIWNICLEEYNHERFNQPF